MDKRGQATLFIVLGMVIIAVFFFIYALESGLIKISAGGIAKTLGLIDDKDVISDYIQDCVNSVGNDALVIVGLQGGYLIPKNYIEKNKIKVAYGYYGGKNILIKNKGIEDEINNYYGYFLPKCVSDLKGYNIIRQNASAKTSILNNSVKVNIRYPIELLKGDTKIVIDENYKKEYKAKLGSMRDIADDIIKKTMKNESFIDIGYLLDIGDEFYVRIVPYEDGRIYMIIDENYAINDMNYTFMFAERIGD